ncbi:MAG: SdrD B-like domain-containing protein, partial [Bacteroidota bacterium]
MFNCENNQITCFPTLYNYYTPNFGYFTYEWQQGFMNWREFGIKGNPITCLPNYTNTMNDTLLAYPLCMTGDPLNNPHSCNGISGISGTVFKDTIANCSLNAGEPKISNVHLMLYNNGSNLVAQTYTLLNGMYTFSAGPGTYTVKIDTVGVPFDVQCANPGIDSTVTLTPLNPTAYNINFPLVCSNGFDVGVQSITHNGPVFPGQSFSLYVCAGDMSQWSHLNCSSGVGGQVQITVNGPVTYQGVANGALTPAVAGNVFTYTIADFGAISNCTDFGLIFTTDTTATVGNEVCFSITVTPLGGDVNPTNNTFVECFNVSNSMDPNFKEVYPRNVPPGYNGYFTFTVHFQNTGNAPAYNIRIIDYLDSDLDLATFDVINYSHANTVSLIGNALTIRFPNIMLPDSTTNADASMGFVQYRIKPKPNLLAGAQITNTANIYFDYNAPVAT